LNDLLEEDGNNVGGDRAWDDNGDEDMPGVQGEDMLAAGVSTVCHYAHIGLIDGIAAMCGILSVKLYYSPVFAEVYPTSLQLV
jgi:hypothetical protein